MEIDKVINKKVLFKWIIASILSVACLIGIILEIINITNLNISTKTGIIHIAQYCIMLISIFIPMILEKFHYEVGIIFWLSFYIFVFLGIFVGSILNVYDKFAQFDLIVHFISGLLIALLAFSLIPQTKNPFIILLFVVSVSVLIGVLWEFYEFSFDYLLNLNMQRTSDPYTQIPFVGRSAILDTMLDLFCDFIGALICGIAILILKNKINKKILITKVKP